MFASQYVRTRSSSFSTSGSTACSSSSSTPSPSSHTHILTNLGGFINKYPPGLGLGPRPSSSSPKQGTSSSNKRPQRPSVRLPYSHRPPPPPQPFRSSHASSKDPFSDDHRAFDPTRTVIYDSEEELRPHTFPLYQECPAQVPAQVAAAPDRHSRSKLVAGILLHRVHAVGKPIRRRQEVDRPKAYVRSGLSRTVSVECY